MARILIVYGTTHGHTAKVADVLAQQLLRSGADVVTRPAQGCTARPDDFDGVIVAASVHAGGYQRPVVKWARRHAAALASRPSAFVSVCLGVLQRDPAVHRELDAIVDRFVVRTGWRPAQVKKVAGALPYTRYNWFIRRTMKRIVAKAGGETDTSRDWEYTDWSDLRAFGDTFARRLAEPMFASSANETLTHEEAAS